MHGWFNTCKSIPVIHHINKMNKYHIIIPKDAGKNILQNSTLFHDKTLNKLGIDRMYLNTTN